jgi:hypothetical protein
MIWSETTFLVCPLKGSRCSTDCTRHSPWSQMGEHRNTGLESASTNRPTSCVVSPVADTNQFTRCSCDGVLATASIPYFFHDYFRISQTHTTYTAQLNNHEMFTYCFLKKLWLLKRYLFPSEHGSSLGSQEPNTGSYPDPVESNPQL